MGKGALFRTTDFTVWPSTVGAILAIRQYYVLYMDGSHVFYTHPVLHVCGYSFPTDHALNCHMGGFQTTCHNEIRDLTANLLSEVCHDVSVEPSLQPLAGESLTYSTAHREDPARLDIRAHGFLGLPLQQALIFDVCTILTHTLTP